MLIGLGRHATGRALARATLFGSVFGALALSGVAARAAPVEKILHQFAGAPNDAELPQFSPLLIAPDGVIYGEAYAGGANDQGAIFQLTKTGTTWTTQVIYSFGANSTDGRNPVGGLVLLGSGALIGTTIDGGSGSTCIESCGTVFKLKPPATPSGAWREQILYNFPGGLGGAAPEGQLLRKASGALIGTTAAGGATGCGESNGCGVVFELTPPATAGGPWTPAILHTFGVSTNDGGVPRAGVIHSHGAFYGTTLVGGSGTGCSLGGCGTVYQLVPPASAGGAWTETIIHDFTGTATDGSGPYASLIADSSGVLYGTTGSGGSGSCGSGCGTVFQLQQNGGGWTQTLLIDFPDSASGQLPFGGLSVDSQGAMYGTTAMGGAFGGGTIFELAPQDRWGARPTAVIYEFGSADGDGAEPASTLTISSTGQIFGTTDNGGSQNDGTVFRLKP